MMRTDWTAQTAALALLALGASGGSARADEPNSPAAASREGTDELLQSLEQIGQLSLAELLEAETTVASLTPESQRSSPGILTVVTRDEILSSGARDLPEVISRVPGFGFGTDVESVLGIGFRGLWGHEGKVLLLVDGHELNEGMYGTIPWQSHFPIDQIEKIEIIRGPGSSIRGGYAELAVINVVTRQGAQLRGSAASASYGQMDGGYARRNLSLALGDTFPELGGLTLSASGFVGQARLSGTSYSDYAGDSFSMRTGSGVEPLFLNLNASWKGLSLGFLYDGYQLLDRTGLGENLERTVHVGFPGYYFQASYELEVLESLKLIPRLRYKRQQPWQVVDADEALREIVYYNKRFERLSGGLTASWKPLKGLDVLAGFESQLDQAELQGELDDSLAEDARVSYTNHAGFAQVRWDNPWVNFTAGARYERHSGFGSSFVPRAGLTKVIGPLHLKALYSDAFRAPGIENISINSDIKPERTRVLELEAGYLLSDNFYATVNLFDIVIDGPIVYDVDPLTGEERYINFEATGTSGAEAVLKYKHARGSASLSYSLYYANKNEVALYAVPDNSSVLLGFARHKIAASGCLEILPRLSLAPSVVLLSGRSGYVSSIGGEPQLEELEPSWILDFYARYRPRQLDGLSIGAGVYNLLDERQLYLQPYNGGHAPVPAMGREIALRVAYER